MELTLSRANIEAEVAADDDSRPVLHGVYVTSRGTVSADGYRLLFVPYPDGYLSQEAPDTVLDLDSLRHAAKLLRQTQRARGAVPGVVTSRLRVQRDEDGDVDGAVLESSGTAVSVKSTPGTFPRWRSIIDDATHRVVARNKEVEVDVGFLVGLLEAMLAAGEEHVLIDVGEPTDPIRLRGRNVPGLTAILMPRYHGGPENRQKRDEFEKAWRSAYGASVHEPAAEEPEKAAT